MTGAYLAVCIYTILVQCQLAYLAGAQLLTLYITTCLPMQAEVQSFYADGAIALHTRSLKYGKVSKKPPILKHPPL